MASGKLEQMVKLVTGKPFPIFQDDSGIQLGEHWPSRLEAALKEVRFLIPVLTPSFFNSEACRREVELFLDFEDKAGREDLVLPVYLIEAEVLEDTALRRDDPLARRLYQRQSADWREHAFDLRETADIGARIAELARKIGAALKRDRASIPPVMPAQQQGIAFRIDEDGLIDRGGGEGPEVADDDAQMLKRRDGLLDAADRFLGGFEDGRGDNAAGRVIDLVRDYKETISGPLSEIDFYDVWRLGSRLQNAADAADRAVARMDLPSLEDEPLAALRDLLREHGPFIYETATGRAEQAKADRFDATQEKQREAWARQAAFKDAVEGEEGLFSEEAKRIIADVNEEEEDASESQHPERPLVIAETTNSNLLAMVGKAATRSTVGEGLSNLRESTTSRAKGFLIHREPVLKGLVASSRGGLAWLSDLIGWVKSPASERIDEAPAIITTPPSCPPGTVFRPIDEPWCPEMVVIPAGGFMMGSPEDEEERRDNEGPRHRVEIKRPSWLGRYPVTFEEFDYFCEQTGRKKPEDNGWGRGRRPVIEVSFEDAEAYLAWLSEKTGEHLHLPSEVIWEYACRAGTETAYFFGNELTKEQANFGYDLRETTEVGSYPANDFDLFDMHGNVFEWCADRYHENYQDAPDDGSAWLTGGGTQRVLRGGSWIVNARVLRSAGRHADAPDGRSYDFGFRCARVQV